MCKPNPASLDNDFQRFFIDKVAKIRYSTVDAPEPSYNAVPPGCKFVYFRLTDCDDVIKLIMSLPDKQCASDPMPTWLLKTCASDLAPFLCRLFNASLLLGVFLSSFKSAYVTPILKMVLRTADPFIELICNIILKLLEVGQPTITIQYKYNK